MRKLLLLSGLVETHSDVKRLTLILLVSLLSLGAGAATTTKDVQRNMVNYTLVTVTEGSGSGDSDPLLVDTADVIHSFHKLNTRAKIHLTKCQTLCEYDHFNDLVLQIQSLSPSSQNGVLVSASPV